MTLIALDLDGTLVDSRADMTAAVHRVRQALGLPARPDDQVLLHVNKGMDALYQACFDDRIAQGPARERMDEVRKAYEADYLAHAADLTKLYPGMAQALKELSELGSLAVVTNKPEAISRRLLDLLGVGKLIRTVVGGDTCGVIKPNPLMLRTAAARTGSSGPAVMIGDTAADIMMGRDFGAKTVWCAWGYTPMLDERPEMTAQTPADLPHLLKPALTH